MKIILSAIMVLNLCGRLAAQTDAAAAKTFEGQMAADPKLIQVPQAENPAPQGQGATANSGTEADVNLQAIWQTRPEVVCKLTGSGSFNDDGGTNSQVKGMDLGSMFEHKGKMYFVFGDTNINSPTPSNDLSNTLAYTSDKNASDCISMHFITMRDVFKDSADFYAKESVLQAAEEKKESYDISPEISDDYNAQYEWASKAGYSALSASLTKKAAAIYNYYTNVKKSKSDLADYYARLSVRLVNLGVSFADNITETSPRNSTDFKAHHDWAMSASLEDLNTETKWRFDRLLDYVENNRVKQMYASKTFDGDYTDIPTYGVSIKGRIYIYIMSIRSWSPWTSNFGALAYSDDDGKTFTRIDNFFPGNSNFVQVSLINQGGYLYLFGIPNARYGGVKLARVPEDKVLDKGAYKYYRWSDNGGTWIDNEFDASLIVPGQVGELSVQWNPFLNRWIMTYLNEGSRALEARTAPSMEGPWSGPEFLAGSGEFSSFGGWGYYAPFIHPTYTENNGQTMYFLVSFWSHYNVWLMKTNLFKPEMASNFRIPMALPKN